MKSVKTLMIAAAALVMMPMAAQKNIPLVYDQEFTGAKYPAPKFPTVDEAKTHSSQWPGSRTGSQACSGRRCFLRSGP